MRDDRSSPTVAAREGREPLRFVVLIEPGTTAPAVLLSTLAKKHATVSVCGDPAQVMVALAQEPAQAVILLHDLANPLIRELMQAVTAYYARTALWHYSVNAQGQPVLQQAHRPAPPEQVPDQKPAPLPNQSVDAMPDQGPLISEQELTLLLAPTSDAGTFKEGGD